MLDRIMSLPPLKRAITAYDRLPAREQRALQVLAVALLVGVLFFGVWRPAHQYRQSASADLDAARQTLAWMQSRAADARRVASQNQAASRPAGEGRSLLATVTTSAQAAGLTLQRFEPSGDDKMRVWLDKVPFRTTAGWLETLASEQGIQVEQASLERTPEVGQVNVRLTLQWSP